MKRFRRMTFPDHVLIHNISIEKAIRQSIGNTSVNVS